MQNFKKRSFVAFSAITLFLAGLLLVSVFLGYRFFFIETPSMGTVAPVGSLVVSKNDKDISKDDIVAYRRNGRVYVHRIISQSSNGSFITKGDLNEFEDALPLERDDIIGRSVFVGKHLGWVWRGLPIFMIGMIIVWFISCLRRVDEPWRWPIRIIGYSVIVTVLTFILNPWMGVQMLGYVPADNGVDMRVVNTGIFPIRDERGGRFFSGEAVTIHVEDVDDLGRYFYIPRPSLGFWGILLLAIWCLIPLFVALIVHLPDSRYVEGLTDDDIARDKRHNFVIFAILMVLVAIIMVWQLSALAGFVAQVSNSHNTARTRTYFTCDSYQSSLSSPRPLFSYSLTSVSSSHDNMASNGGSRNGQPTGSFSVDEPSNVCGKDGGSPLVFNGSNTCVSDSSARLVAPNVFSVEAWFKTNKKSNGKIIGFGSAQFAGDAQNDRNLYIDKDGRVVFGVFPGVVRIVRSPAGVDYADNQWHHVVATLSGDGLYLYLDGKLVEGDKSVVRGENATGYWKVGCGSLRGWRHATGAGYTGPSYYTGSLRNVALYDVALTAEEIAERYEVGTVY